MFSFNLTFLDVIFCPSTIAILMNFSINDTSSLSNNSPFNALETLNNIFKVYEEDQHQMQFT